MEDHQHIIYVPAYLGEDGQPFAFGTQTTLRQYAQADVDTLTANDPENTWVLATRVVNPWVVAPPVTQ